MNANRIAVLLLAIPGIAALVHLAGFVLTVLPALGHVGWLAR